MECERLNESNSYFSSSALIPGDPPQWSIGPESNLTNDPRLYPIYELQNARSSLWSLIDGWEALHNFVPILYPNKDTEGWEYNLDFHQNHHHHDLVCQPWTSYPHIGTNIRVRRRIWMRTCIKSEWLYKCRSILTEYINFHPRGVCYMSPLEIFLHSPTSDEGDWHRCIGILRDQIFELKFIDNKNKRLKYSLSRTEVKDLPNLQEQQQQQQQEKVMTNNSHSKSHSRGQISYRFMLTKKGSNGNDLGTVCILRTLTFHEKQSWIIQFVSQLDLLHICSNYPLHPFGPPVSDKVVIEGHMWKRGHVIPNWKYRFFRLRESGALTYYHNDLLKGRIQLKNCVILDNNGGGGHSNDFNVSHCSFVIQKNETSTRGGGKYELVLKTTDRKTKLQWMTGISLFCGNQPTTTIKKIKFPSKGPLYSYENIYNESQGKFLKKFQHVDVRDDMASNSSRSNSIDDRSFSGSISDSLDSISLGTVPENRSPSRGPRGDLQPKKSALKSSRRQLEGNFTKVESSPTRAAAPMSLPSPEENIRYFSSSKTAQGSSSVEIKGKQEQVIESETLLVPEANDDDDDDELDPSFYGLEEEDHQCSSAVADAKVGSPGINEEEDDQEAGWEDDDDLEDEEAEADANQDRKSSFSVVSNLKEYLSHHQDSAALMELMGLQEDH
jgi:hypothetical protein